MTQTHYSTARSYWDRQIEEPEVFGIAAMGDGGYSEVVYRQFEEVRHFRSIVPLGPQTTFLELGSGSGRWIMALAPVVARYDAVDFSQAMIELARQHVTDAKLTNVSLITSDAINYVPEKKFDVIYLSGVSQYVHDEDLVRVLERLKASLNPGGVIVDRSTTHQIGRKVVADEAYFSIYRTTEEIVACFERAKLRWDYTKVSYPILVLPKFIGRILDRRKVARLILALAPLSYGFLRLLAFFGRKFIKPSGNTAEYSHEFSLFRPVQ